jgi:WD40 repeat protein
MLFNHESGEGTNFIPIGLQPSALAISPDGATLAVVISLPIGKLGGFMGLPITKHQIQLYALPDGNLKGAPISDLGACANSNISNIAFTPDGSELVFEKKYGANEDRDIRKFCIASLAEGKVTRTKDLPADTIMAISPNGEYAAASEEHGTDISIYTTSDFSLARKIETSPFEYGDLSFSSNGQFLGMNTYDTSGLRVWSITDGKLLFSGNPLEKDDILTSIEVTDDSGTLYLGTSSGFIEIISTADGALRKQLGPFTWESHNLTMNPNGLPSSKQPAMIQSILLSSDERSLVVSDNLTNYGQIGSIHLIALPDGKEVTAFTGSSSGSEDNPGIAFSPDSQRLALADFSDGHVEIYDAASGQLALKLVGHSQIVNAVGFSPDNEIIATASDDTTIKLWDAHSGILLQTLAGHQGRVNHLAFSPDSSWLISGADDNTLRRWNVADGKLLDTLDLGSDNWRVEFLDILQDNTSVIYRLAKYPSPYTGFIQRQVLWNTQSGESRSIGSENASLIQLANDKQHFTGYSGKGLFAGSLQSDGSLAITDTFRSPYGNGALVSAAISPNHRLVVSANGFGLQAWELSGNTLSFIDLLAADQPMPAYGDGYLFSPDGKYLAFTSGGVAYLLGVPSD